MSDTSKTFVHPKTGDEFEIEPLSPARMTTILRRLKTQGISVTDETRKEMSTSTEFNNAVCRECLLLVKRKTPDGSLREAAPKEREKLLGSAWNLLAWIANQAAAYQQEIEREFEVDAGN